MTASTMADTPRDHIKHTSEPKKRKRNRKAQPDKKFECQHEGCGKSYSRAEHLHRHQLNRTLIILWSLLLAQRFIDAN